MSKEYKIDEELQQVMPKLSEEEYTELENSLLQDGFKGSPIIIWQDIIIDGHNRYEICKKHNIPYEVKELEFSSKEEVIQWMIRAQLGRRNLSPLQRIKLVETYRPVYEKQAAQNKSANGGNKKSESEKSTTPIKPKEKIDVRAKLASDAGVSTNTYSKGKKILDSNNLELIRQVENGEKSINKAFNEIKEEEKVDIPNINNTPPENAVIEEINFHEENVSEDNKLALSQIQQKYMEYLDRFQDDIAWLISKDFLQDDEEVTGKIHSDLQNCLEKFKGIKSIMENMQVDDLDGKSIVINR
ncbi:MAG: hypothetical protein MR531_17880 [Lachnospiraceae bacterium]|nr:hypothetical protein [Lachnospiraceae bacterium]